MRQKPADTEAHPSPFLPVHSHKPRMSSLTHSPSHPSTKKRFLSPITLDLTFSQSYSGLMPPLAPLDGSMGISRMTYSQPNSPGPQSLTRRRPTRSSPIKDIVARRNSLRHDSPFPTAEVSSKCSTPNASSRHLHRVRKLSAEDGYQGFSSPFASASKPRRGRKASMPTSEELLHSASLSHISTDPKQKLGRAVSSPSMRSVSTVEDSIADGQKKSPRGSQRKVLLMGLEDFKDCDSVDMSVLILSVVSFLVTSMCIMCQSQLR